MARFNPNAKTLSYCLEKLKTANAKAGFSQTGTITTSRDNSSKRAAQFLKVTNVPKGFKKFMLPVHMADTCVMYTSVGAPDTKVATHSHDEGDGFRFIVSGSIIYKDQELTSGDWMHIPAGKKYAFTVGLLGVTMFYCYRCCCA